MPKFRIKKVSIFGYGDKDYKPGDIVELPDSFAGLDFLEPVQEEPEKREKPHRKG